MELPVFTRFYLLNDRRNKVKSEKGFSPFSFPSYFSLFFFFFIHVSIFKSEILFKISLEMGLYNLQNICKILTPLFTLASSIDIHNLKSSFDPKHL